MSFPVGGVPEQAEQLFQQTSGRTVLPVTISNRLVEPPLVFVQASPPTKFS
jgi:hypothetical protein